MTIVTYIRPSGQPIEVNDTAETRALAQSLGWVMPEDKPVAKKAEQPKKGRK